MLRNYELSSTALLCLLLALAGCVPIQPEPRPAAADALPSAAPTPAPTATLEPTATPEPSTTAGRADASLVSSEWQEYVNETLRLSISYPPGWFFFGPTTEELSELLDQAGELAVSDEVRAMVEKASVASQQEDLSFAGMGFELPTGGPGDPQFLNNMNAIVIETGGLPLDVIALGLAVEMDRIALITVENAEVASGLRDRGGEVVSVLYSMEGAGVESVGVDTAGWQVGVSSPDGEAMVLLTFTILAEQFAAREPLLAEVVRRLKWLD